MNDPSVKFQTAVARELSVFWWLCVVPAAAIVTVWWNWAAIATWYGPVFFLRNSY